MPAHRLSTAFDSVTLYGCDPDPRPDIYGKVGNSCVSIATLDDMKVLFDGFNLCCPTTSVSISGYHIAEAGSGGRSQPNLGQNLNHLVHLGRRKHPVRAEWAKVTHLHTTHLALKILF